MTDKERVFLHTIAHQLLGDFDMPADRTADSWPEFVKWIDGQERITTKIRLLENPRQIDADISVSYDRNDEPVAQVMFAMENSYAFAVVTYRYDEISKLWEEIY